MKKGTRPVPGRATRADHERTAGPLPLRGISLDPSTVTRGRAACATVGAAT